MCQYCNLLKDKRKIQIEVDKFHSHCVQLYLGVESPSLVHCPKDPSCYREKHIPAHAVGSEVEHLLLLSQIGTLYKYTMFAFVALAAYGFELLASLIDT